MGGVASLTAALSANEAHSALARLGGRALSKLTGGGASGVAALVAQLGGGDSGRDLAASVLAALALDEDNADHFVAGGGAAALLALLAAAFPDPSLVSAPSRAFSERRYGARLALDALEASLARARAVGARQ